MLVIALAGGTTGLKAESKPVNVLWIIADDLSPDLGCYGNSDVTTPNLDRLAREGAMFTHAFTTAPVCSASRSAFQTGVYQTVIDAQNQRSHRGDAHVLPEPYKLLTEVFRAAGYHTANIKEISPELRIRGKTDFNFHARRPFDGDRWEDLKGDQPFFAQVNFLEPHRGEAWTEARQQASLIDPASVTMPPIYPDHPVMRDVWANYLDAINLLDRKVGEVLALLERDGLADNTLVMFFGDNGRAMFRGKGTLYEGGIRVPLIVRWPGRIEPGTVRTELVSAIDFAPTVLAASGVPVPAHMTGRDILSENASPRRYVFAARDRIDEIVDCVRAVRTGRFKYIRNFHGQRSALEDSAHTRRAYPELFLFRELQRRQMLTPAQELVVAPREAEELYDLVNDPNELENLAGKPEYQLQVAMLRHVLMDWIVASNDTGAVPEDEIIMPAGWYERNSIPRNFEPSPSGR